MKIKKERKKKPIQFLSGDIMIRPRKSPCCNNIWSKHHCYPPQLTSTQYRKYT